MEVYVSNSIVFDIFSRNND